MASRLSGIAALVARCKKAGWTVTPSRGAGGGWRVKNKQGAVQLIHSSYSDRNAILQVKRMLKNMGLDDDEAAAVAERESAKSKRLAEEAKAASVKGSKLARESQAANKAAGPYAGPEELPLEWFIAAHPAPMMRWVIITPTLAAQLLEYNTDNRPMKPRTVLYYKGRIEAKQWYMTHQGMAMDTRIVLQDGQQRLQACVDADMPITTAFFVGMPPDNFKAIDEGRNRSGADLLGKDGEVDTLKLAATVRLVAASREPRPRAFMKLRTPNENIYDTFKGDPERLRVALRWAGSRYQKAKLSASALAAARYLLVETNGENTYVEAFCRGLVNGTKGDTRVMLDEDDPRLQLHNQLNLRRIRNNRTHAVEQLGLVLWAWNCIVSGRRARHVKWGEFADNVPTVMVCADSGTNASATPELLRGEIIVDNGGNK